MNPLLTVTRKSNAPKILAAVAQLKRKQVYVGIPEASSRARKATLKEMAGAATGKKKARLTAAANEDIGNAELMYIHSKGSPRRGIPARPVIEPAIVAEGNKEAIAAELAGAAKETLEGNEAAATKRLQRAGISAETASRKWFTDPRNNWAPNAPSTIKAKGSDRPLIDQGALRQSITHVIAEE